MRPFLLFFFLFPLTTISFSQELTGVWRGSFYNVREMMLGAPRYRYEVQIDNRSKNIKGVTYSYQTTRFYGKASLVGVWTPGTQNLVMKEERMEDLKIEGGGEGCLMTCYLDYHKEGEREFLEGTYSSRNMNNGTDCGAGRVFLEKVPDSDFEKEDFLKKNQDSSDKKGNVKPGQEDFLVKKPAPKPAPTPEKKTTPPVVKTTPSTKSPAPPVAKSTPEKKVVTPPVKKSTPPPPTVKKPAPTNNAPVAKSPTPASKPPGVKFTPPVIKKLDSGTVAKSDRPSATVTAPAAPKVKVIPPPQVLKQRKNELFQTITTTSDEIVISFYDNGEIDGDTISVYDNNRLLVKSKGLSASPINVTVKLNDQAEYHEIVMVAENLGSIPPNTALMMVQAGSKKYTVRLSSSEKQNAMVRFYYEPATASVD